MTAFDVIIKARIELLSRAPVGGANNPPVWDQQPNPIFTNGTASNYEVDDLTSDPDGGDTVTISFTPGDALQSSVTWNDSLDRFEYDGTDDVSQSTGHICVASDGTDTTDSNTFNVQVQAVASAIGFPRVCKLVVGARTESTQWTDPDYWERLAASDEVCVNFAPADTANVAALVTGVKADNPNVRIMTYRDWSSFNVGDADQLAARDYVIANYVTDALPGGTATDGMSRTAAGVVLEGWPNKEDVNPTDFPNLFNSELPAVYWAKDRYDEFYTGALASTIDDLFWDIWRSWGRDSDQKADWNRDGDRYDNPTAYEGFDPTGNLNSAMIRTKDAIHTAIQTKANSDRGENLRFCGNIGSWFDWWDGARADNDVITSADATMVSITDGGLLENWGWLNGLNTDGTSRASGNFERGYKQAWRTQNALTSSTATDTKRVWGHFHLDSGLYDDAAYLTGVSCLAGIYCDWMEKSDHKDPGELDEFYGQTESGLTVSQRVAAMHWMGLPVGNPPEFGDAFQAGVQGGIVQDGVYGRVFANALLYVNPIGNGGQTITGPTGNWKHITGTQRAVNDGSNVGATFFISAGTAIFMEPQ